MAVVTADQRKKLGKKKPAWLINARPVSLLQNLNKNIG
jgi:hypothetical protein